MTGLRVLVLGSYPALNPRHGGQVRLSSIVAAYRARGFEVAQASFFPAHDFYTQSALGPADVALPVPALHSWRGKPNAFVEDLAAGDVAAADTRALADLERHAGKVDFVHLEQPWLLPVVHKLRERGAIGNFELVYGSQNIEHELKRAILRQHHAAEEEDISDAVLALERRCAQEAAVVAAVTNEDAQALSAWTSSPVVLAGNGVTPWHSDESARTRWRERIGPGPFALYVASAHPPNIQGLCESFGASLAGLSPVQRIVLAGHVGEFVVQTEWFQRWQPLNERRTVTLGVLDIDALSAVRDLAHTFLLPVTSGGGSNLKTAEALYSGRHVVATPLAMRGFEHLSDLPGLRIVQPGADFAAAVSRSLGEPQPAQDAQATQRRESLGWPQTLAALCDALAKRKAAA
jgi:hypothetical protein